MDTNILTDCWVSPPENRNIVHPSHLWNVSQLHQVDPWPRVSNPPTASILCTSQKSGHISDLMDIYNRVNISGVPNYIAARIPLPHDLNIPIWRLYLEHYPAIKLCDYLEFGFPINYTSPGPPWRTETNHSSATAYPEHITNYITELSHGALMGPFTEQPFQWCL